MTYELSTRYSLEDGVQNARSLMTSVLLVYCWKKAAHYETPVRESFETGTQIEAAAQNLCVITGTRRRHHAH
ncbi:hypothetical protein DPMN_044563 [Dreissena polymorpha]|uniref:Uncharacterized protein n=1 Tax=Dreissena polymorpha TaxID=45954 RepID=A0A9D4HYV1_DREPO|nr:hypothetical protein DPMN_044563 [Dreissena polymorpha]